MSGSFQKFFFGFPDDSVVKNPLIKIEMSKELWSSQGGCNGLCGRSVPAATDHAEVWPRGATPRPRLGWRLRGATPCPRTGAAAERSYPTVEVGAAAKRSYPTSKVRDGSGEEQRQVQGAVAARAQEGREELLHVQGQEGRL